MNFDVRSYCERLAKADPERFEFIEFSHADHFGRGWLLVDRYTHYSARGNETPEATWAFVGPLADEFGVEINGKLTLESTFAAVVEKLEDAKPWRRCDADVHPQRRGDDASVFEPSLRGGLCRGGEESMIKIVSLFQRNYDGDRLVRDEVVPGAEWVLDGEGVATRKHDGTCCMIRHARLFKRHDAKNGKTPPDGFEPAQDPDPKTGHWPGWLPVGDGPDDRWHREAWDAEPTLLHDSGTWELCGPKINGNLEKFYRHILIRHGVEVLADCPRDFDGIRAYLADRDIEGIVWHHEDGRMVKIKGKDFGIKRAAKEKKNFKTGWTESMPPIPGVPNPVEYARADIVAEKDARIEFLEKALEQATEIVVRLGRDIYPDVTNQQYTCFDEWDDENQCWGCGYTESPELAAYLRERDSRPPSSGVQSGVQEGVENAETA